MKPIVRYVVILPSSGRYWGYGLTGGRWMVDIDDALLFTSRREADRERWRLKLWQGRLKTKKVTITIEDDAS